MQRIALFTFLYLLLHGLGYYYPARLWGTDQLHYYSPRVVIVCGAVALGAMGLLLRPAWMARLDEALLYLRRSKLPASLWQGGLVLAFTSVAYLFRDRSHVLGDSGKWFSILQHALLGDVAVADIPGHHSNLQIAGYEYINFQQALDLFVHFEVYRLGHALWGWQPSDSYEVLSCLAGGLYALVLWKIAALLTPKFLPRWSLWGLLLTMGSIQYFFGYGESYTLATLVAALYIWSSLHYLQGRFTLLYPTLTLALAGAFHLLSFSLALSWLYLLWRAPGRLGTLVRQPRLYGPALAAGAALAFYVYVKAYHAMHLPLWQAEEQGFYAILSVPHLANWANQFMLLGPFGLVWGLVFLWSRKKTTPHCAFLGWAALGTSSLLFVHYISMGGRDWDLMAFSGLFCMLWGCACLQEMDHSTRAWQQVRWGVLPILFVHSALWIGINHDVARAHERLGNLLKYYPNQPLHYQQYTLGHYYLNIVKKDFPRAAQHLQRAIDHTAKSDSTRLNRYEKNLGVALYYAGQYEEAMAAFASAFGRQRALLAYQTDMAFHRIWLATMQDAARANKDRREALLQKAVVHIHQLQAIQMRHAQRMLQMSDYAGAEQILNELIEQRPNNAEAFYRLGVVKKLAGDIPAAIVAYNKAIELKTTHAETYFALGLLYEETDRHRDAASLYGQLLADGNAEMNPDTYVRLGIALFSHGDIESAKRAYQHALGLDEQHIVAKVNWGWCLYLQNDLNGSIAAYRSALAHGGNIQAQFNMGLSYLAKGDLSSAHAAYAEGIAQYGAERATAIGAADDLRNLVRRNIQAAAANDILRRYWSP